jgi:hypothetical protein
MSTRVSLVRSRASNKRLDAIFVDSKGQQLVTTRVPFGQYQGSTYVDHQDDSKKAAYLKRHRVRENWQDPRTPGALSRWILWNKPSIEESLQDYCKRFKMQCK